jgi:mannose-1-phosphate guanylyltransferase/mannose-6-phosphate isomerase
MITVILAGGKGTRLWPLSTEDEPKQFVKFLDGKSLFQLTLERYSSISSEIYVVTVKKYAEKAVEQAVEIGVDLDGVLIEPVPRGTLSAMTLAIKELQSNEALLFAPSDHVMETFSANKFSKYAEQYILIFGIKPRFPSPDYGYILPGEEVETSSIDRNSIKPRKVKCFKEKPDVETAKQYLRQGYLWNSGIYMFSREVFEEELQKYAPEHYAFLQGRLDYKQLPEITIDYAISEKSNRMAVVPLDVFWTDLGTYKSLYEYLEKDEHGNAILGNVILENCENSLVINCHQEPVVASDLKSQVLVHCHGRVYLGSLEDTKKPKKFSKL